MIMVKNLLRVHLLLCMDSYAECSTQLVLEVIRVLVHHQEYMAEKICIKNLVLNPNPGSLDSIGCQ